MSAEGGGGFNHNLWAQMNLKNGGGGGGSDGVNEKELPQMLVDTGAEHSANLATKLTGGLLPNLNQLGQISILQPFEKAEGWASKMINEAASSMSARGGFLANLFHSIFIKNGAITDHTQLTGGLEGAIASSGGEGGGGGGEGGGGGDAGGGGSSADMGPGPGGGGDFPSASAGAEMVAVSHGDKFTMVAMSEEKLGGLTPKATGDAGFDRDSGVSLG